MKRLHRYNEIHLCSYLVPLLVEGATERGMIDRWGLTLPRHVWGKRAHLGFGLTHTLVPG